MSGLVISRFPGLIAETEMKYKTDWRDVIRHLSNLCFVGSYLFFERGMIAPAACCTIAGEIMLAPSALKQKSWSTVIVGGLFFVLALGTLSRTLFG
jgi:hypothetical protein